MKGLLSDGEILGLYASKNEEAIAQTEKKYGRYLLSVARNVLDDGEDCREVVNDALYGAWKSVPSEQPSDLKAYLARTVRNAALNRARDQDRDRRAPRQALVALDDFAEYLESPESVEKAWDDRALKELIDRFVSSLSKKQRYVFVCRYFYLDTVPKIASSLGKSERAVFKELAAIRERLKTALRKEGF